MKGGGVDVKSSEQPTWHGVGELAVRKVSGVGVMVGVPTGEGVAERRLVGKGVRVGGVSGTGGTVGHSGGIGVTTGQPAPVQGVGIMTGQSRGGVVERGATGQGS